MYNINNLQNVYSLLLQNVLLFPVYFITISQGSGNISMARFEHVFFRENQDCWQ